MKKVESLLSDLSNSSSELNLRRWNYYQEWNDSVFLHFEVPFHLLDEMIPSGLELDSYNNKVYVSLVAFSMNKIRPRNLISLKFVSDFHEINIRTYVKNNNKEGVYFINIEAEKRLSVFIAKKISKLPYEKSFITRRNNNFKSINYEKELELDIDFNIEDKIIAKTNFDKWLLERYCLFYEEDSSIFRYDIYHEQWKIQQLDLIKMQINYQFGNVILEANNLVKCHYSKGVNVLSWARVKTSS